MELGPFVYLKTYRVLVCLECRFGCVSDEVPTHLRTKHRDLAPATRRLVAETVNKIPGIIKNQTQLATEFRFPLPTTHPIPELAPPQADGRACRKCSFVIRQDQKIQEHCGTCQSWVNPQGRGRPKLEDTRAQLQKPWREGVLCQRFFLSRAASGWFEVGRKLEHGSARKLGRSTVTNTSLRHIKIPPETRTHLDQVLEREEKYLDDEKQPRFYSKALDDDSFATTSLWLERTRWPITYRDVRRDVLLAMSRLPVRTNGHSLGADYILGQGPCPGDPDIVSPIEEEQKILCILSAVDAMLDRCQLTAQNTNRVLLCWLASSRLDVYQPKPFALTIEETTQKRYRGLWKRFITFILRSYLLSDLIREQEVKVYLGEGIAGKLKSIWEHRVWQFIDTTQHKWPRSRIFSGKRDKSKPHQSSCENSKVELFLRHRTPQHNDSGSPSDDELDGDYDSSEDEYEEFEESESEDGLDNWTSDSMKQEDFNDSQLHDSDSHETRDGSTATSIDEFLELLFQLSFELSTEPFQDGHADSALLVYFSGVLGFSSDCRRFQLAREYCPYLSGLIWIQRLIFLEYALPLYPYPTIGIQQRPYMPMQRLNDVRQKYMVSGSLSPLAELHSLRNFGQKVAKTEPPPFLLRWSDDGERVSYGDHFTLSMDEFRRLSDHFITRAEQLCDELMFGFDPNLDVRKIKDDLTNTQPGFSFVTHPDNMFEEIYKDLLVRVCTSRSGRLVRNGGWSAQAVMAYLRKVTTLEENISGGLLTACGQSPRIRDLLSVAVENSPCAMRGIFVWNGSMAYSIKHHKAKRSTNQEFYVVRFLPARLAAVVLKHLVCIRRLAALLRREQFGFDGSNRSVTHKPLLFQSYGKAWSPTRVTRVLRMASKQAWNWEINARIYRQLAIGITEKHVREVHSPFNRYDDRSIDADLNVAFAWQSGHRPLQRGITYGLDGAYPHQLQPSLLRAYEWASTRWHEFIHLVSKSLFFLGQEPPTTSIQHARSSSIHATAFIGRHDGAPATISIRKRKRESLDEPVTCSRKTLNSSLAAPTRPAISIDGLAAILPEYPVLVCLICKTAVRPGEAIESHFRRQHCLKGDKLKAVKTLHSGWLLLDPAAMAPMDNESLGIPELAVQHGFSCKACIYLTISRDNVLKHCCQRHPELAKSGGRNYKEVSLQTWMKGKFIQYWTVLDG